MTDVTPEEAAITADLFEPEPKTNADYMKAMWYRLGRVEAKVTMTNGRVRGLEKMLWAMGGGIAVLGIVIAPIFVTLVSQAR